MRKNFFLSKGNADPHDKALTIWEDFAAGYSLEEIGKKNNVGAGRIRAFLQTDNKRYNTIKALLKLKKRQDKGGLKEDAQVATPVTETTVRQGIGTIYCDSLIKEIIEPLYKDDFWKLENLEQEIEEKKAKQERAKEARKLKFTGWKNGQSLSMNNEEEMIIEHLKKIADELGRPPYKKDLCNSSNFSYYKLIYYFGSLEQAQRLAGLTPNKTGGFIPWHRCIEDLNTLEQKFNRKPTWQEVKKYGKFSADIYKKRLGRELAKYIYKPVTKNFEQINNA